MEDKRVRVVCFDHDPNFACCFTLWLCTDSATCVLAPVFGASLLDRKSYESNSEGFE